MTLLNAPGVGEIVERGKPLSLCRVVQQRTSGAEISQSEMMTWILRPAKSKILWGLLVAYSLYPHPIILQLSPGTQHSLH
jgi:hypothetical protein